MKRLITLCLLLFTFAACRQESAVPEPVAKEKSGGDAAAEQASEPADADVLRVGRSLPSLELENISGGTVDLANLKGKVTLLNVWATWCGPCRVEIPELIAIQREYAPKGVEVVGITVDAEDALDEVKEFIAEQKMNYRNLHDPEGKFATRFDASVIPISVLVDRQGKVVWIHYGLIERTNEVFQQRLQKALAS